MFQKLRFCVGNETFPRSSQDRHVKYTEAISSAHLIPGIAAASRDSRMPSAYCASSAMEEIRSVRLPSAITVPQSIWYRSAWQILSSLSHSVAQSFDDDAAASRQGNGADDIPTPRASDSITEHLKRPIAIEDSLVPAFLRGPTASVQRTWHHAKLVQEEWLHERNPEWDREDSGDSRVPWPRILRAAGAIASAAALVGLLSLWRPGEPWLMQSPLSVRQDFMEAPC